MFTIALTNVLVTLFYLFPGYILRKMGLAKEAHLSTLSAVLIYIGTPFMEISSFMSMEFSWESAKNLGLFFAVSFVLQALFMVLMRLVLGARRFGEKKYRVMTIASFMGNVGFFGIPIVSAVLPGNPEAPCYAALFALSMNLLAFTIGVFCLTGEKKYMSLRAAVFNPTMLGFVLALPFYFFGLKSVLPAPLIGAIETIRAMTTPLCMFILGIRLASARFSEIWNKPVVYAAAFLKLLVFPFFCYAAVSLPFWHLPAALCQSLLILAGTPCASVILSLSELHHTEPDLAADSILVSTLLCFLTIPLLTLAM